MKRPFDPLRLDVEPFARESGHLEGQWPLGLLRRLPAPPQPTAQRVAWQADAEQRRAADGDAQIRLRLRAVATVTATCQRCLLPIDLPIDVDRRFRFARDEAAAEALDAEVEDDVLALSRSLDLRMLVEDELLLALPLVPRHDRCPDDALAPPAPLEPAGASAHPFAALAVLKKKGRAGG